MLAPPSLVTALPVSAVVATVLIIMITVAAVGIIWAVVLPMIRDNISVTDLDIDLFIPTDLGYTAYDADKDYVFIQVARGIDHHELKGIMIILDLDGVSHSARVVAPGPNEAKSYLFKVDAYTNNGAEPLESVHAKVAPIFLLNKQERIGETTGEVVTCPH